MSKRQVHYWDAVCVISYLREDADRKAACDAVMDAALAGELEIAISALTIAEVLHLKGEPKLTPELRQVVRGFFRRSVFVVINVDRYVAEHAQDLFWDHGIRPKDAIHVASALRVKATVLDTFDDGLLRKTASIGDPPLLIQLPQYTPEPKKEKPRKGDGGQFEMIDQPSE